MRCLRCQSATACCEWFVGVHFGEVLGDAVGRSRSAARVELLVEARLPVLQSLAVEQVETRDA